MLTPAMCNNAVMKGAELYIKLMLQGKNEGSFQFYNLPLGPNPEADLEAGVDLQCVSDKSMVEV